METNVNEPLRVRSVAPGTHRQATADEQRTMLERYVADGQARATTVVERIFDQVPEDRIVRAHAVRFPEDHAEQEGLVMHVGGADLGLHDNALGQLAGRLDIPAGYARDLRESPWGRRLLARNLNDLLLNRLPEDKRFLVRSVDGEVRGVMSSKYRRLDSRPIVEAFLRQLPSLGAVVCDGVASDIWVSVRALVPRLVEPFPGEFAVFGVSLHNSDFGCGALTLSSFLLRVWCTNAATMEDALRKIHVGARLDDRIEYSQRTYELDTATMTSAVKDVTGHLLGEGRIDELTAQLQKAAGEAVDAKAALAAIRSKITKGEAEAIAEAYNGPDVEMLPPGNTRWRFSNAVSLVAGKAADADRRLDLEQIAGDLVRAA